MTDEGGMTGVCANTDIELWRKTPDYYSPSLHITENGAIGINCGGLVFVLPIEVWHDLAKNHLGIDLRPREP